MVAIPNSDKRRDSGGLATPPPEEVTILVTGFGAFHENYPKNPAWEIARGLPDLLEPTKSHPTRIRIRIHSHALRVAYRPTVDIVPKLLEPSGAESTPDLVLHIGLASMRRFFAVERGAHRGGYAARKDVDGEFFRDQEGLRTWPDSPRVLHTGFDLDAVVADWKEAFLSRPDGGSSIPPRFSRNDDEAVVLDDVLRVSEDAGDYMCAFIFYNSMAWFHEKRNGGKEVGGDPVRMPVNFLHVPGLLGESELAAGRDVTISLIRALVESQQRFRQGERPQPRSLYREEMGQAQDDN